MEYKEALDYLNNTARFSPKAGLARMTELMERLGNPQKELRFVHVAGTNGKGSCSAMLAAIFRAAGYRTGLYTSPYIYRFNERMQVNGKEIGDEALSETAASVKAAADAMDEQPTGFELMTAAAFLWFKEENCDIVVLEAGMGGRNDATNIISPPEAAVIMNIGLDHTNILGDTVEQIADDKAGIIKPGCDCVLYEQSGSVTDVIRSRCDKVGAALHTADFSEIESEFDSLFGQSFTYRKAPYAMSLLGAHQLRNAAVALDTVDVLRARGWKLSDNAIEHGLYSVSWPGRFELINDEPPFILDGGHNPQCMQSLTENLERYFPEQRRVLLVGMLADKDHPAMLELLIPAADEFVCITPPSPRALSAEELAAKLRDRGKTVYVCDSIPDGIAKALELAGTDGMVCAAGSLYSVGEIRYNFGLY